jgi:xylulokinase
MRVLAIDVGSSSVKAAVLDGVTETIDVTRGATDTVRVPFASSYQDDGVAPRAQVDPSAIEAAVVQAIGKLKNADKVDLIGATVMSPSWLAMDSKGRPLTAVVTHQDRRSVAEAQVIERIIGRERHLKSTGNRPYPGGISSTTFAWHLLNEPAMKKAALVGHLSTWLIFALTGERAMDLSNAGFTGLLAIDAQGRDFGAWDASLIDAVAEVGKTRSEKLRALMPYVCESNRIVGKVKRPGAKRFGVKEGTPVIAGCMDGSAAMLAAGAEIGQLTHISGSTDVLALCTDRPYPTEGLLTRPLGVDRKWLSIGTISSCGTSLDWVREAFFSELPNVDAFYERVEQILNARKIGSHVKFINELAGSRTAMEARYGAIGKLSLGTKRDDIVRGLIQDLCHESGERMRRLGEIGAPMLKEIFCTGGVNERVTREIRREWPRRFKYRTESEATLHGLLKLAETAIA